MGAGFWLTALVARESLGATEVGRVERVHLGESSCGEMLVLATHMILLTRRMWCWVVWQYLLSVSLVCKASLLLLATNEVVAARPLASIVGRRRQPLPLTIAQ